MEMKLHGTGTEKYQRSVQTDADYYSARIKGGGGLIAVEKKPVFRNF
jgi:hypothetical protein